MRCLDENSDAFMMNVAKIAGMVNRKTRGDR